MEKEQTRIDLRCRTKVCPSCNEEFDEQEHNECPIDKEPLWPIEEDSLIGKQISEFEIISKIGTGSSSNVYAAILRPKNNKLELAETKVAIKILDANLLSDPIAVKRFQMEAEMIRSLNHPCISAVLDFGVLPDGRPFLILEHVEGITLKEHIAKKGRLTPEETKSILTNVLDAVEEAHNKGILHRDLKPGNIILDQNGNAKVVDFGIAKAITTEVTTSVTVTGASLGTPAYMSPEQCQGKNLDARSDIYSLGCLIYECLSGQKVFPSENAFSCMRQHSFHEPIPLAELVSDVPDQLTHVVMKCLEKDVEDRVQSIKDLKAILDGKIILEKSQRKRSRSRENGHPLKLLTLYLVPIAVLTLIVVAFHSNKPAASQKPLPRLENTYAVGETAAVPTQNLPDDVFFRQPSSILDGLKNQFATIEKIITRHEKNGKLLEAAEIRGELTKYQALLTSKDYSPNKILTPSAKHKTNETLYVNASTGRFDDRNRRYKATLNVTYTGNPITLILSSGNSIDWRVNAAPGVKISKIYLWGLKPSTVSGISVSTKVINQQKILGKMNTGRYHGSDWLPSPENLQKTIGNDLIFVQDFDPRDTAGVVGPENLKWRAQHLECLMDEFYQRCLSDDIKHAEQQLSEVNFDDFWSKPILKINSKQDSRALQSLANSREAHDTGLPIIAGVRGASKNEWYLLARDGMVRLESKTKRITSLPAPSDLPEIKLCTGITRDTKRNRILVLSSQMFENSNLVKCTNLYSYEPDRKTWTLLSRIEGAALSGLGYSVSDDTLYALAFHPTAYGIDGSKTSVLQLSPDGDLKSSNPVADDLTDIIPSSPPNSQIVVHDRLLITTFEDGTTTVIDRNDGQVLKKFH